MPFTVTKKYAEEAKKKRGPSNFLALLSARDPDFEKRNTCPMCAKSVVGTKLKDDESIREFEISGMCQACQDKTFG